MLSHPILGNNRFRIAVTGVLIIFSLIVLTYHHPTSMPSIPSIPSLHFNRVSADTKEEMALCIATRNNHQDLQEFFTHHYHHHGIRRFYIMDDRSHPPLSSYKEWSIPRQHISFQYFDEKSQTDRMQEHIYAECQRMYGPLHTWLGIIDADEFIEVRTPDTLRGILKENEVEGVGALAINWRLHTSNGLLTRPESARKAFTSCALDPPGPPPEKGWKDNRAIKSFFRTAFWDGKPWNPHQFRLANGSKTVGEHGDPIGDGSAYRVPITRDRIGLHHYTTKSKEQFELKMSQWTAKDWTYWDHIEGLPQEECLEMTKYDP